MNSVVITGVAGFIGHGLAKYMLNNDIRIIGIDNMVYVNEGAAKLKSLRLAELHKYPNFIFINEDIRNISLQKYSICNDCTAIVHLAASAGIKESKMNARIYIDNNILGFCNIIENAHQLGVKHFIYASSSSIYGDIRLNRANKVNEASPKSIYAITKYTDELIAHLYSNNYNLKTTGLRFFSVYGPYGRPDMAPWIFMNSISNNKTFNLANEGLVYRDFTYIDDIILAVNNIIFIPRDTNFAVYDIGSSQPHSILELVRLIEFECNIRAKYISIPLMKEEAKYTIANMDTYKKDYGNFNTTPFEIGIRRFCNWYKMTIFINNQ